MLDFSNTSKKELEEIVVKLDNTLMELHHRTKELPKENLEVRMENEALIKEKENLENALYLAAVELTKAYKASGKTNEHWLDPVNWMTKFLKGE